MLGMEFLIRGAREFNEPGVLVAFEETPQEMECNVASLGFDLKKLVDRKKIFLDYVFVEPSEIEETGDYDLEGRVHPPTARGGHGGREAHLPGHAGGAVSGFSNEGVLERNCAGCFAG